SPGDSVEAEDALVTVESDKASMDVPAPFAGTLKELCVKVGDKISHNDLLAKLEVAGDGAAEEEKAEEAPAAKEESAPAEEAPAAEEKPAAEQSSGGSETIEVTVPDIGDSADVDVIEILVSAGDTVEAEDGLITLETDKATMDVPSPQAGKVVEVKVKEGDKVSEGSLVLLLEVAGSGSSDSAPAEKAESAPATESAPEAAAEEPAGEEEIEVTVPDIGDASDVDVIEILVAEGDTVAVEDGLITLETDKATMDVPSPKEGVVTKLLVKSGDKVSKGDKVCMLKVAGSAKPAPAKSESAASAPKADSAPAASKPAEP
ncbi:MAG: pyruvate dehydrogenase complex dihydrolipoyllysine-residue acetyltransferase, partial [Mesoflavibacter sp.]|nr:pyruvate dehydrogenase complex dihydrolipoyllysine-residue acetyltransferase [Mesoflavibacter sp.]